MNNSNVRFTDLPDDCVCLIAEMANTAAATSLTRVSKHYHHLLINSIRSLNLSTLPALDSDVAYIGRQFIRLEDISLYSIGTSALAYLNLCPRLRNLSILNCGAITGFDTFCPVNGLEKLVLQNLVGELPTMDTLAPLLSRCGGPGMRELILTTNNYTATLGVNMVNHFDICPFTATLAVLKTHCLGLQKLTLKAMNFYSELYPTLSLLTNLKSLNLGVLKELAEVAQLLPVLTNLQTLSLQARNYDETDAIAFCGGCSSSLQSLSLQALALRPEMRKFEFIIGIGMADVIANNCTNITELNVGQWGTVELARVVITCPKIRSLTLSGIAVGGALFDAVIVPFVTSLRKLHVRTTFIAPSTTCAMIQRNPHLKELSLRSSLLVPEVLDALTTHNIRLESLVANPQQYTKSAPDPISSEVVNALVKYLKATASLKEFSVHLGDSPSTYLCLVALSQNHRSLKTLRLTSFTTSASFVHFQELSELDLQGVSSEGFESLIEACPRLRKLRTGKILFSDDLCSKLVRRCPLLSSLYIHMEDGALVTDDGVSELVNGLRRLHTLDLRGATHISDQSLLAFNHHCSLTTVTLTALTANMSESCHKALRPSLRIVLLDENSPVSGKFGYFKLYK